MKAEPLVSIFIPSYNHGRFLAQTIQSVLNQTYRNLELIVVENGSTDDSPEIVRSFSDPRMTVLTIEKNCGVIPAWKLGFRQVKGDYFSLLGADDYYHPERVEKQIKYLQSHPEVTILGSYVTAVDDDGKELDPQEGGARWIEDWINQPRDLNDLSAWRLNHHLFMQTALYETRLCEKSGLVADGLDLLPDYDFHLRLLRAGGVVHVMPERLAFYRIHNSNMSAPGRTKPFIGPMWVYAYASQFVPLAMEKGGADTARHIAETMHLLFDFQSVHEMSPEQIAPILPVLMDPLSVEKRWPTYTAFKAYLDAFDLNSPENAHFRGFAELLSTALRARFTTQEALSTDCSKEQALAELSSAREESARRKERIEKLMEKVAKLTSTRERLEKKLREAEQRPASAMAKIRKRVARVFSKLFGR